MSANVMERIDVSILVSDEKETPTEHLANVLVGTSD